MILRSFLELPTGFFASHKSEAFSEKKIHLLLFDKTTINRTMLPPRLEHLNSDKNIFYEKI
jgi:hypothetical protein